MERSITYEQVRQVVEPTGLICRGGFHPDLSDNVPGNPGTCIMVGNAGAQFWQSFMQARPEGPDPIETWTADILGRISANLGADVLFPFSGPPYHPFLTWAQKSEPVWYSPIGPLIHPVFGLWHAYRGLLLFQDHISLPEMDPTAKSPCESCDGQPCLTACPVDAVTGSSFDVDACSGHIGSQDGTACLQTGCAARRACPVGHDYLYPSAQANYHMQFFLDTYGPARES